MVIKGPLLEWIAVIRWISIWKGGEDMYFSEWIQRFLREDTPFGDLAYDISRDKGFPRIFDKQTILDHLKNAGACREAVYTFKRAWKEYEGRVNNL